MGCSNFKKSESNNSEKIESAKDLIEKTIENRFLYVFDVDSLKTETEYELTIEKNDSIIKYHYKNITDSEKNMNFKFVRKSKLLTFFGIGFEFKLIKKEHLSENKLSKLNFDLYVLTESIDDGNGPMFFNPNYGILNLDNGWGRQYLFLNEDKESEYAKNLMELIYKKTLYNNV